MDPEKDGDGAINLSTHQSEQQSRLVDQQSSAVSSNITNDIQSPPRDNVSRTTFSMISCSTSQSSRNSNHLVMRSHHRQRVVIKSHSIGQPFESMVMDKSCVYSFRGAVMTPSNAAVFGRGLTACVSSGNLSRILLDCRSGAVVCHKMLVSGSSFRSVATIVDHLLCVSCVCAELKRSNALFSTSRPDAG